MSRDRLLDSEERNSLALGAMAALGNLIAGQEPGAVIEPSEFAYLFRAVEMTVKAAIELPCSTGGCQANDD